MLSLIPRILLAITLVAAGALAAIDFSSLPECARSPILNTIGRSKCDPSKPQCLCKDDVTVNGLVALIAKACSGDDLTKAVTFGRVLCPNLATQTVATISDAQTTYTITLHHPAGTTAAPAATATQTSTEVSVTETPESNVSPSETTSEQPTASVTAANGTGPEEFQGVAPEFGPVRLWGTILSILTMGVVFAEL